MAGHGHQGQETGCFAMGRGQPLAPLRLWGRGTEARNREVGLGASGTEAMMSFSGIGQCPELAGGYLMISLCPFLAARCSGVV